MKYLSFYIQERLHINKDTGKFLYDFKLNISNKCDFTKEEINEIISIINEKFWPEIIPKYITNYKFDSQLEYLSSSNQVIYLFYVDNYMHTKINNLNYIMIFKSDKNNAQYTVDVHIGNQNYFEFESDWHNSIKDAFDECLNALNKDITLI